MLRRDQLRDLCAENGGQVAVAKQLRYSKDHMNKMVSGFHPLSDKASRLILETFPDFELKSPSKKLIAALHVLANDTYSGYLRSVAYDALNAMGEV